ncbi:MSMEG_1061 family FMN-dependent PPOX-type flavoprotein [Bradyrhizobium sp. GCM10023182]|uniref:Pyridoxamine 5'-phosphate oxidase family protein n=1 Tax=Bradyrhizobium zhengyangense TaxID=2911009 RepID=A0ABS9LWY3_9BRAD|nr:MSMEG_1061 family FMN-dependent PPOX-type flavoprotein [Bradyrhizobium zhengyangense]MCG2671533.1 pyridoxamine 5'-phosphate oxidase family protein [Bradyrhizobium zhengyangense]
MYQPAMPITNAAEVRAILGSPMPNQVNKVIDHIDDHCRAWIARTPFIVISSIGAAGAMDISPKGDPPGFVRVLDKHTLAVPDRIGNHRGDTVLNILDNPSVGIVFIIPMRREVVRVSGTASLAQDPGLLEDMAVNGKHPDLAIVVRVREAFFHCGKSVIRSGLWEPDRWKPVEGLPTYAQALKDHAASPDALDTIQARIDHNEAERLY